MNDLIKYNKNDISYKIEDDPEILKTNKKTILKYNYSNERDLFLEMSNNIELDSRLTDKISIDSINNNEINKRDVNIMVQFIRIGEIDTMSEKYQAEIGIEARWLSSEHITDYDPKKYWNPLLFVENILSETKQSIEYSIFIDENNNQIITEYRTIKGVFWERLELQNFPVDVQELTVTVCSKRNSNEINLVNDDEKLSYINVDASNTFIDQQKWHLFNLVKISHIASYDMPLNNKQKNKFNHELLKKRHSKICATCFCARKPGYYISNAIFLIFLITLCGLNMFSVDPKLPQNRLQSTITLILTSVSFKWVINRSLPTVSYLTSLDKYAIISIFYLVMICAWHAIVGALWKNDLGVLLDKIALGVFGFAFITIQIVYAIWMFCARAKVRELKKEEKRFVLELDKKLAQATIRSKFVSRI